MTAKKNPTTADKALIQDFRRIIEESRESVAAAVNAGLTMLYWRIGRRMGQMNLQEAGRPFGKLLSRHCLHTVETIAQERRYHPLGV